MTSNLTEETPFEPNYKGLNLEQLLVVKRVYDSIYETLIVSKDILEAIIKYKEAHPSKSKRPRKTYSSKPIADASSLPQRLEVIDGCVPEDVRIGQDVIYDGEVYTASSNDRYFVKLMDEYNDSLTLPIGVPSDGFDDTIKRLGIPFEEVVTLMGVLNYCFEESSFRKACVGEALLVSKKAREWCENKIEESIYH